MPRRKRANVQSARARPPSTQSTCRRTVVEGGGVLSNVRYISARTGFLDGSICWATGVFRAHLWRGASYVATHSTVRQVIDSGGVLVATSDPLITFVTASGAADALDATFPSIAEGPVLTVMTVAQTSGPAGGDELPTDQQRLVCFLNRGRKLPLTPTGRPITVRWSDTAARIFQG